MEPDLLLRGRLRLHQAAKGHRAGTDAILLAAAAPSDFAGTAVDLGAGVGTVGLILALRCAAANVHLVDDDATVLEDARRNVLANGLDTRVRITAGDVFARETLADLAGQADLVLTNPPYLVPGSGRPPVSEGRRRAYLMREPGLPAWVDAAAICLKPGGTLVAVHRADAVPDLLAALKPSFGGLTLLPILPKAGAPAHRILLRARKGSHAPFTLAAPIVLQDGDTATGDGAAIARGEAPIIWPT